VYTYADHTKSQQVVGVDTAGCIESRHEGENFLQTVPLCHSQWSPYSTGQAFNKLVQNIHTAPKLFHNFSLKQSPTAHVWQCTRIMIHSILVIMFSRPNYIL